MNNLSHNKKKITISIDAMGGDNGGGAVIAGIARSLKASSQIHFLIHGKKKRPSKRNA